ncbi:response regulator [Alkalimarinus alittae]|uniref:Response regulator n=1 Tax=Alkalimarinus alittae TaxID=2961619 RepID=A0ABY6N208_9ALTE|nr:response regulator [Alkalimarinus alittae]UZE96034.1 response regulator [Alkalimarinus alittae]
MSKPFILCVDDDRTILMSLRAQLRYCLGTKFSYEIAESAEEAWEVINEIFDVGDELAVVISDCLMPKVKGDALLIALHEKYPRVVKIMLTGHADPDVIERVNEKANLAACLTKPWSKEDLVNIIKATLEDK